MIDLINKIGKEELEFQGYDKMKIIDEIKTLDNKHRGKLFMDLFDYFVASVIRRNSLNLFFVKEFSWIKKRPLS